MRLHKQGLPMPNVDVKESHAYRLFVAARDTEKEPHGEETGQTLRVWRIASDNVPIPNLAGSSPAIAFASTHIRVTSIIITTTACGSTGCACVDVSTILLSLLPKRRSIACAKVKASKASTSLLAPGTRASHTTQKMAEKRVHEDKNAFAC